MASGNSFSGDAMDLPPAALLAPASHRLLGVRFDALDLVDALSLLAARDPAAPFAYVVTPNADHWIRLQDQPALRPLYEAAWLSLCDSRILRLLAARRGVALELAPGSDLTQRLFDEVIGPETPVTVIGGTAAVVETLRARYRLARLAHHNPPMGFIRDPAAVAETVDFVRAHPAQFVFLCVGSPQQEKLAAAIVAAGGVTGIGLCVGAAAEFVAGVKQRAPDWVQRANLEWLHRLGSEPRRLWRRYLLEAPRLLRLMGGVPRGGG
jgi:exopolysaccharide biosynthesis WecB/TagA/CpsF family protein